MANWLQRVFGVKDTSELETRDNHQASNFTLSDPILASWFTMGQTSVGEITAHSALQSPAFWRGVNLISGVIAGLPLKTYREDADGNRIQIKSFLDDPGASMGLPAFNWVELVVSQLLLHGEVGLIHVYSNSGAIIGLTVIPANNYSVEWAKDGPGKVFTVRGENGTMSTYSSAEFTQIVGMSLSNGLRGVSPLNVHRGALALIHALEDAATNSMTRGMLLSGLVSTDEEVSADEAVLIKKGLDEKLLGPSNASGFAFVNRKLKFDKWTQSNVDAQFLQSREFQVDEVGRLLGLPAHLLGSQSKATSWGTGIIEMNIAMQKYTFRSWTDRIESALSRLLPNPRFCEFEYAGLFAGSPQQEVELLIAQSGGPILTPNEARAIRNLPAVADGDKLRAVGTPPPIVPPSTVPSPNPDRGEGRAKDATDVLEFANGHRKRTTRINKTANGQLVVETEEK